MLPAPLPTPVLTESRYTVDSQIQELQPAIPGLSITFLTVPVAVAAMILGPKGGAICGAAFGITSLMQCFGTSAFGAMLLGINPFGTVFTCIVPRILEGLLSGLIFKAVRSKNKNLAYFAGGLACPVF